MDIDGIELLRKQQDDFIDRLKLNCIINCQFPNFNSEITVVSGELKRKQIMLFCFKMLIKLYSKSPPPYKQKMRRSLLNNLKGKLGEEALKVRLDSWVTEVDYKIKNNGDDNVDFRFTFDSDLSFPGIQVKTRNGSYDEVTWSITNKEVEKNTLLVCMLIQKPINFNELKSKLEYNIISAGFLPTTLIKNETIKTDGKYDFKINQLLYSGGLKPYIQELFS